MRPWPSLAISTVWDQINSFSFPLPLLSLCLFIFLLPLLFLILYLSRSQKPRMLTGDILRLWGQECKGKQFPSLTLLQLFYLFVYFNKCLRTRKMAKCHFLTFEFSLNSDYVLTQSQYFRQSNVFLLVTLS